LRKEFLRGLHQFTRPALTCAEQFLSARKRLTQYEGLLALPRIQIGIPRAHGQSIGFAHDGADHDLDRTLEIAHHTTDDGDLGRVLLSKESKIGLDDVEEL